MAYNVLRYWALVKVFQTQQAVWLECTDGLYGERSSYSSSVSNLPKLNLIATGYIRSVSSVGSELSGFTHSRCMLMGLQL